MGEEYGGFYRASPARLVSYFMGKGNPVIARLNIPTPIQNATTDRNPLEIESKPIAFGGKVSTV